jgi:hypothetical protein
VIPPATFRKLCFDKRLSHGAVRFWHCLKQHSNDSDQAFPSQRTIADEIGCKIDSIKGWISELFAFSYLKTERVGRHHNFRYTLLPGDALPTLPEWCYRVPQNGDTKTPSRPPKRKLASPKRGARRVPQNGDLSNSNGSIKNKSVGSGDPAGAASPTREQRLQQWQEAIKS